MNSYLECINLQSIPKGYWGKDKQPNISNHKNFYNHLGVKLGYTKPEDWYKISQKKIKDFGGAGFLGVYYEGSAIQFVKAMNKDYKYKDWLFNMVPQAYWNDVKNVKEYIEWLYNILEYKSLEDWYSVKQDDFRNNNGMGLQSKYNCILINILKDAYSDYEWLPWKFDKTNKFWGNIDNQRKFVKYVEEKENINKPEDWYTHTGTTIIKHDGVSLLNRCSFISLISIIYPNYEFITYKFKQSPHGYWNDSNNRKNYLKDLFNHKGFTEITDWYSITYQDFLDFYGSGLIDKYGSCYKKILMENIEYEWDEKEFTKGGYSKKACNFLDRLSKAISMQISHKLNTGEHKIDHSNYSADGYIADYNGKRIIIEYNGCCYHGCPKCYPNDCEKTFFSSKTYKECLDYTDKRKLDIQSKGYIYIDIWECDDIPSLDLKCWFEKNISVYVPIAIIPQSVSDTFILQPSTQKYNKNTGKKIVIKREIKCPVCDYKSCQNINRHIKIKHKDYKLQV